MATSTALARYDAACRAVAEAKSIDEVKGLRDKAEAMRAYARQAKNKEMEVDAAEIRIRAERRLGEMITAQKETVGLNTGAMGIGTSAVPKENRTPTLAEAGIDKKLSARAQKIAAVPEKKFEEMLGGWRERVENENEKVSANLLREGDKAQRREEKLRLISAGLPDNQYAVIYADPPWRFEPYSRETGMDRAADNHYPTMTLDGIKALPISMLAADDAVLFLWATAPMLPHALEVMAAWGFTYKSHQIWNKDRIGTGYWFRSKHELLLVGTRGSIPAPAPGTQLASVIDAPVARHSAKPTAFREQIARLFADLPKIELFARESHDGWAAWGNEIEEEAA